MFNEIIGITFVYLINTSIMQLVNLLHVLLSVIVEILPWLTYLLIPDLRLLFSWPDFLAKNVIFPQNWKTKVMSNFNFKTYT